MSYALSPTVAVKAGASGAILGLLGVLAGTRIRQLWETALPSRFRAWHIVAMVVAFYGFAVGAGPSDHLAHLGGLACGCTLALALPTPGRLPPTADRALGLGLGLGSAAVTAAAAVLQLALGG
jgi:membrane associated rhomboid family serine protease